MSPRRVGAAAGRAGGRERERPVTVTVDGEPVTGAAGQSIAGVLLADGRAAWRRGRTGAPRGVFCGIGVCFDCLVTVDGDRDVRACLREARDGAVVTTQSRHEDAAGTPTPTPTPNSRSAEAT